MSNQQPPIGGPSDGASAHTPRQQQLVNQGRDAWLVLEAAAYGYRDSVKGIERKQALLDWLSIALALWLLVTLWGIGVLWQPGENQKWLSDLVNVIGTVLAFAVISLVIWSWRAEWRGRTEKQRVLADRSSGLAARYLGIFQAEQLEESKLQRADADRRSFESDESHPLAGMPQRSRQLGFQHVGQRYPVQNIRCGTCGRNWEVLSVRRRSVWTWLRLWNCETCGVSR